MKKYLKVIVLIAGFGLLVSNQIGICIKLTEIDEKLGNKASGFGYKTNSEILGMWD